MPPHILIFNAVQILVCGYAWWRGGQPERVVALLLMAAGLGTLLLPAAPREFDQLHWRVLAIDVALLAALIAVALRAARFWPLWLAAMHLIAIAVHFAKAYHPFLLPWIYAVAVGQLAYTMLALLLVGTIRHQHRRRAAGADPDWSA